MQPEEEVEERDVQSRAYALASLQQVVQQLFSDAMDAPAALLLLTKVWAACRCLSQPCAAVGAACTAPACAAVLLCCCFCCCVAALLLLLLLLLLGARCPAKA
jgi:hypothetical protein